MSLFDFLMSSLMAILSVSLIITMVRLVLGPSVPDRTIAFDLITTHIVGLVAIYTVVVDQTVLLDAIIVIAVLSFLATVAVARYIEGGRK